MRNDEYRGWAATRAAHEQAVRQAATALMVRVNELNQLMRQLTQAAQAAPRDIGDITATVRVKLKELNDRCGSLDEKSAALQKFLGPAPLPAGVARPQQRFLHAAQGQTRRSGSRRGTA